MAVRLLLYRYQPQVVFYFSFTVCLPALTIMGYVVFTDRTVSELMLMVSAISCPLSVQTCTRVPVGTPLTCTSLPVRYMLNTSERVVEMSVAAADISLNFLNFFHIGAFLQAVSLPAGTWIVGLSQSVKVYSCASGGVAEKQKYFVWKTISASFFEVIVV